MKIILTGTLLSILRTVSATTCVGAPFRLELEDGCSFEPFYDAFKSLFEDPLSRKAGCTNTLTQDLDAYGVTEELVTSFCESATFPDPTTTFSDIVGAAGGDALFTKQYYDGGTNWNEEVETIVDGDTTNVLKEDATVVDAYYEVLQHEALQWPNELSNFDLSTCELNVAMCCWVQDRQAKDGDGNCKKPYDTECVDKDPADNTDLCLVHLDRGSESNHVKSNGISVFPGDNGNGEGPIHCHGHAWGNDLSDFTSRYKANNLFYVSMYDHMYKRGYVRNVPGAPMCGCVEQMPIVSRSDCTQTDVEEKYAVTCDESLNFSAELINVEIEFNACQGKKNNDLWSYYETLYSEKKVTLEKKNKLYSHLVGDKNCPQALERNLAAKGFVKGISDSAYPYVLTFPEVDTSQFVHGICVVGASSATAISTDTDLVYKEVPNFQTGQTAWGNRDYLIEGVEKTICKGGIFLQPNRHKKINQYSEITVGANAIDESVKICAFVEAKKRDGNWPETIVEDSRFEDYGASTGLGWSNKKKLIPFHLLCKTLPEMPTMPPTTKPSFAPGTRQQKITYDFPTTQTNRFVHGLCVTNLASVSVSSTFSQLTYEANPIVEDMKSWKDRTYTNVGVKGGPCEGGTFLQPSRHKSIPKGTKITLDLERGENDDAMTVCAFVSDTRDGNWPSVLVEDGFTNYQQTTGLAWMFNDNPMKYDLICKDM